MMEWTAPSRCVPLAIAPSTRCRRFEAHILPLLLSLSLSLSHTHTHTYTTHSLTQGTGGAVFIESGLEKVLAAPDILYPPVQVS